MSDHFVMARCHDCQQISRELDRQARLVAQALADTEDALRFDLDLSERLDLVAEEHQLRQLLEGIELRTWTLNQPSDRTASA